MIKVALFGMFIGGALFLGAVLDPLMGIGLLCWIAGSFAYTEWRQWK